MIGEKKRLAALLAEPSTDAPQDGPRLARVERSRGEMLAQGPAIAETLARQAETVDDLARRIAAAGIKRVVIAGCGDSWFCAIAARPVFEHLAKLRTEAVQALDWAAYASVTTDRETLVIGLSSGGSTPAVMAALRAARDRGAMTIGMSNTAGSPVVCQFDAGLLVHATRRGWPTQSSTAAIALLDALAARLAIHCGRADRPSVAAFEADLAALPSLVDQVAAGFDAPAKEVADRIAATRMVLFAGAGPHYAAAAFGAAKAKELGPVHAIALPLEEFHHYRTQKNGDPLFLVAPDEASAERALDTVLVSQEVSGHTIALLPEGEAVISPRATWTWHLPAVRWELAPILYSIPLHLFSYHFAKARFAAGLGYPGAFPEGVAA